MNPYFGAGRECRHVEQPECKRSRFGVCERMLQAGYEGARPAAAAAVTEMFPWRRMFPNTRCVSLAGDTLKPNGGPRHRGNRQRAKADGYKDALERTAEFEGGCSVTGAAPCIQGARLVRGVYRRWVSLVYVLRCASMTGRASRPSLTKCDSRDRKSVV